MAQQAEPNTLPANTRVLAADAAYTLSLNGKLCYA